MIIIVSILLDLFRLLFSYLLKKKPLSQKSTNVSSSYDNKIHILSITPASSFLIPNQEQIFKIKAFNKVGNEINPGLINWTTTGGKVDDRGRLIVNRKVKGIFEIRATSPTNNLTSVANYTVLPILKSIYIIPDKEMAVPGEKIYLQLIGRDQTEEKISIEGEPVWNTSTGQIDFTRMLVVNTPNQLVCITARIQGLEAKNTVSIGNYPSELQSRVSFNILDRNIITPSEVIIPISLNPELSPEDNLPISTLKRDKEASRLVTLEIDAPDLIFLRPDRERVFVVHGINQFGEKIDPGDVVWRSTGGKIDSQGKLTVNSDSKGNFNVTATSIYAKNTEHNLAQTLLLFKFSLRIFSWILSQENFINDVFFYFIQDFYNLVEEKFPENLFETDEANFDKMLTILNFEDLKERLLKIAINLIIKYLNNLIASCFSESPTSLSCSVNYIVLPELKSLIIHPSELNIKPGGIIDFQLSGIDQIGEEIKINENITWKATGGKIDSHGKLFVYPNSQGNFKVTAKVGKSLNTSSNYNVLKLYLIETEKFWSATGGIIYSAELGSLPTFIFHFPKKHS